MWKRFVAFLLIVAMNLSFPLPANATIERTAEGEMQGGQSNIVNGSFEEPDKKSEDSKNAGYLYTPQSEVNGWKTTSTEGKIELGWLKKDGSSPHMIPTIRAEIISGVGASDGWQFAETIGNETSTIFQSLPLQAGLEYQWTVHHRGRNGVDTLALFLVKDAGTNYVKTEPSGKDHFTKIVEWMKTQGVSAPAAGEMTSHTVYTTALGDNGAFTEAEAGFFSFTSDAEHTVKFEVYLMSTGKANWGEYTGSFNSESSENVLFALTCFKSASPSSTSGNLVDNLSFFSTYDRVNLLANPGFEDVTAAGAYSMMPAANAASPNPKIGWSSTASDYKVEIGNLSTGKDAYGLGVKFETVTYNAPSIREGDQFAELNADQESSLYQIVDTDPGKMYKWSLSHRGRDGLDTMALVIGPDQPYEPKKTNSRARDQLMQIVDWLYDQKDVVLDIPEAQGCSSEIKLYTPKFNANGGFAQSKDIFSWYRDEVHTEEWSVWIISSKNDFWYDYGALDRQAEYQYDYIVPIGQNKTIFGFVSVKSAPRVSDGKVDMTYGNFLDNIAFREYYYFNADFSADWGQGDVFIQCEGEDAFLFDDRFQDSGWALAGNKITVSFQQGDRDFVGAYINGVFHPVDEVDAEGNPFWIINKEDNIFSVVVDANTSLSFDVVFQAKQVIYDSRNFAYPYRYDLEDYKYPNGDVSGREVPMVPGGQYISHSPYQPYDGEPGGTPRFDGWKFVGWRYIESHHSEDGSHLLDAAHMVKCDSDTKNLSIWEVNEVGEAVKCVVDNISFDEGIMFFAEWMYRQRVIAQTFDSFTSQYVKSTDGGTVAVKVAVGEGEEAADYSENGTGIVGQELHAYSGDTYISITAQNKIGYTFNGWYDKPDEHGKLISRSPNYTYKVEDGGVWELYARFVPVGFDLTIHNIVYGEAEGSEKYFAVDCSFSKLRENQLYAISGLTESVTVAEGKKSNPTRLQADASGQAKVTIYLKDGDAAVFSDLPEHCVFSVKATEDKQNGFTFYGEVPNQIVTEDTDVTLIWSNLANLSLIAAGKHYLDIFSNSSDSGQITITKNSSYSFYVATKYVPAPTAGLSITLCYDNGFAAGTRILMIDRTNEEHWGFYAYSVETAASEISLQLFTSLGANETFVLPSGTTRIDEAYLFVVDYAGVGAETPTPSGTISLVHRGAGFESKAEKQVVFETDKTQLTAVAGKNAASVGPFEVKLTVSASSPAVNTTYDRYAAKLSMEGGDFPAGAYALVENRRYNSHNGYILISPFSAGEWTVTIYSPKPLSSAVNVQVTLLSAVSTAASIPVGISQTVAFSCVNAEDYAMKADVADKVISPGEVQALAVSVANNGITAVDVTVAQKNGGRIVTIENISLQGTSLTVNLENPFLAEAGETYILTFVGYADGVAVCTDECEMVCGYLTP